jgi:hypothetical protein
LAGSPSLKRAGFLKGPVMVDRFAAYYAYPWSDLAHLADFDEAKVKELHAV